MCNKTYRKLEKVVDSYIFDVHAYFLTYNSSFKKQAQETKSRPYGGYEVAHYADQFNYELSCKRTELLERIEMLFVKTGRKLSSKQHNSLIEKCTTLFDSIIMSYEKMIKEEFGDIESINMRLSNLKFNNGDQIKSYIEALKVLSSTKIDKALFWTAFGVIVSAIFSLISIIIDVCSM